MTSQLNPASPTYQAEPRDAEPKRARASTDHGFRLDIEGMRAVAITFVVLYHAEWSWAAGGYRGVDIFFVLSGFLITRLLLTEAEATGRVSLVQFWARRARRLLPAATAVTLFVLAAGFVLLTPFDQITSASSIQTFALYASNIFFAAKTTEYFGGGAHLPMLHTWSLSVEEQYYLLFAPIALWLAVSRRKAGGSFRRSFAITTLALTAASLVVWLVMLYLYPLIAFFILPSRFWELGLGAITAIVANQTNAPRGRRNELLAIGAFGVMVASGILGKTNAGPFGLLGLAPTLGTAVLIYSGMSSEPTFVAKLLSTRPLRLIGRLSYDWYLWHWPLLIFLGEVVARPSPKMMMAVAWLSLIPAAITYRFISSPIRFSPALQRRPRLVVVGALVAALLVVALGALAKVRATRQLGQPRFAPIVAAATLPRVYDNGCHLSIAAVTQPTCMFGAAASDTTVVLFGDSHAAQWFPALDTIASRRHWRFASFTKSACPSVSVRITNGQLGREYWECDAWRRQVIERINALHPMLIVIANTRAYEVLADGEPLRTDRTNQGRGAWYAGLGETLRQLAPAGARILVMQNNPHPGFDVPSCLAKNVADQSACPSYTVTRTDTVVAAVERAAVRHAPVATMYGSLNDLICNGSQCPIASDGIVRYMDSNHISVPFAVALAPAFDRLLDEALKTPPVSRSAQ